MYVMYVCLYIIYISLYMYIQVGIVLGIWNQQNLNIYIYNLSIQVVQYWWFEILFSSVQAYDWDDVLS